MAPPHWATTYETPLKGVILWMTAADNETAGLRCAPETGMKIVDNVATARPATTPQ